jgi:hypothetical protein
MRGQGPEGLVLGLASREQEERVQGDEREPERAGRRQGEVELIAGDYGMERIRPGSERAILIARRP